MSITRTFAIALFLVFGSMLFSCKDEHGNDVPVKQDIPQLMLGSIQAPPPVSDSISSCNMLMGEVPMDNTEIYNTVMVDGGIEIHIPEPIDPPAPIKGESGEMILVGVIAYDVVQPVDPVPEAPVDSVLVKKKDLSEESFISNPDKSLIIYPNPSAGEFTIAYDLLKRSDVNITIYDMNGALVKKVANVNAQYEGQYRIPVNLNELPNGIYVVSMINNGIQSTERIVITK